MMRKGNRQLLFLLTLLLLALAARFMYPAGRMALRQRGAEVFAADARKLELVEAMGRAVSGSDERIAALKGGGGTKAA